MAENTKSSIINPTVLEESGAKRGNASGMPSVENPAEQAVKGSYSNPIPAANTSASAAGTSYSASAGTAASNSPAGNFPDPLGNFYNHSDPVTRMNPVNAANSAAGNSAASPAGGYSAASPVGNSAASPAGQASGFDGETGYGAGYGPGDGSGFGGAGSYSGGGDSWYQYSAQLVLQAGDPKKVGTMTITKAAANAVRTAANSNQEEYQTIARRQGMERLEDMAVILAASDYHEAYADVQKYGQDILDYSTDKGQGRSLDAQGQSIVDRINASSPVQVNLGFLRKNAGRIYSESSRDGSHIILSFRKPDGTMQSIKTGIAIKQEGGKESLLQEIGSFNAAYRKQDVDYKYLTTDAGVNEQTLVSLNSVRTGNYKALDRRLKLTERYNNHVFANNGYKDPSDRLMIRNFSGKKEEIERLKSAVDEHGNSIFAAAELAELEECVNKNGLGTEQGKLGMMARDAFRRSRQRIASNALDEYQGETLGIVQKSARVARTAQRLNNEVAGLAGEFRAASVNKKVNNLLNQRDKLTGASKGSAKLEKIDRKLERHGRALGADKNTSASELRKRASAAQDRAKEIRQARRDMNRAVRGLGRKERKEVVMRLRMEDALARNNSVKAERLVGKHAKLCDKINKIQNRKRSLANAVKKVKKKAGKKAADAAAKKVFSKTAAMANGIRTAVSGLLKKLLTVVAAPLAAVILIIILAAMIVTMVFFIVLLFAPDTGDKNVIQTVNEEMNKHEVAQLLALQARIEEVVKRSDAYESPETLSGREPDSMCWQKDGLMNTYYVWYHNTAYPIEGVYVRRRVRVARKNLSGRMVYSYETRWCEVVEEPTGGHKFYLQYRDYGSYGTTRYTSYVWNPDTNDTAVLFLDNTAVTLPKISKSLKAGSAYGRNIYSTTKYVWVNFGDTDDDGEDNFGWTQLADYGYGNAECYYVKFTIPGDKFWESDTTLLYCMKFSRSDGKLERQDLRERLLWSDRDDKVRPDIDMDYDVVDENGRESRICNCMQAMTLYRYYYHWTDEGQEDSEAGLDEEDRLGDVLFLNNYKRKMEQAWDLTHFIKTTQHQFPFFWNETTDYEGWKKALKHLKLEDIQMEDGLPGLSGEGRRSVHTKEEVEKNQCDRVCYYYAKREGDGMDTGSGKKIPILDIVGPYCAGHYLATVSVITLQSMDSIAEDNTLEGRFGINIEYSKFSENAKDDIRDLIGCYEDGFAEGFQNWADFEVYFGPAKNMLTEAEVSRYLDEIEEKGGLNAKTKAFLQKAIEGCGRFTYQRSAYSMEKWDVSAGFADSAGYVNWARNSTGQYNPEIQVRSLEQWTNLARSHNGWKLAYRSGNGTITPAPRSQLASLSPGTVLVSGDPDRNRIAIWTGLFTNENKDSGNYGMPIVIECISDTVNGSIIHTNDDVRNWLYYVPPDRF